MSVLVVTPFVIVTKCGLFQFERSLHVPIFSELKEKRKNSAFPSAQSAFWPFSTCFTDNGPELCIGKGNTGVSLFPKLERRTLMYQVSVP